MRAGSLCVKFLRVLCWPCEKLCLQHFHFKEDVVNVNVNYRPQKRSIQEGKSKSLRFNDVFNYSRMASAGHDVIVTW